MSNGLRMSALITCQCAGKHRLLAVHMLVMFADVALRRLISWVASLPQRLVSKAEEKLALQSGNVQVTNWEQASPGLLQKLKDGCGDF